MKRSLEVGGWEREDRGKGSVMEALGCSSLRHSISNLIQILAIQLLCLGQG